MKWLNDSFIKDGRIITLSFSNSFNLVYVSHTTNRDHITLTIINNLPEINKVIYNLGQKKY